MPLILALSLAFNLLLLFLFLRHRRSNTQTTHLRQQNQLIKRLQDENDYFASQHREMQKMIAELSVFIEQIGRDCQNGKSGIINLPAGHPHRQRNGQMMLRIGRHLKDHFHLIAPPASWYQETAWKEWKNFELPAKALELAEERRISRQAQKQEV